MLAGYENNPNPELIKFVFDDFITICIIFICFSILLYLLNKRKEYKEFKKVNKIGMVNGLPDINSIKTEVDRWNAIRRAEDKIMEEKSYMLCRVYREYMSLLEKKSL